MNIDEINEREKAENYINAVIDNYKQDIKGTLYQKLNQEDVRDFLVNFYIDVTKKLEKENKVLTQNLEDTEIINKALEKENAELKTRVSEQSERIREITQELDDEINRLG